MNKKLEEEFNLPPTVYKDEDEEELIEEKQQEAAHILNALSSAEKVDYALGTVSSLDVHDTEMDEISEKALEAYKDLLVLGMNAPIGNASRLLEVASMMLKTALDARSNKAAKKLKVIELQLRKAKLDSDQGGVDNSGPGLGHKEMVDIIKNGLLALSDDKSDDKSSEEKPQDIDK